MSAGIDKKCTCIKTKVNPPQGWVTLADLGYPSNVL